ncbi:tRNA pseudouridine13 synthase [Methanomicrobium sp. W14]|uniref:tRNA pseudouridine(13) synthase TruD n=1 Tax=Methanomicrobium sp. W14 TaxID=2817839 RepID=UPI001AE18A4E|nr:tRNA pseudouridine(13) synthase TruD [Methanomicrobium sp. W14]MBP2132129.1 tRNA pseudouridine13 synthase [Methanomicrobium sp. W14]
MIKSPYETERLLGIEYYLTDKPGCGGILRKTPGDFKVNEIFADIKLTGGPHLICELSKTNWELQRAVKEIANRLGISHKRISWGGTKDKRAETKQLISIYGIKAEDLDRVHLKDIELKPLGYARQQMSLGDLKGNSFDINICDCTKENLPEVLEECSDAAKTGLCNYYGIQRFGTLRPVSHLVGIAMLKGDFEDAVMKYAGYPCRDEREETRNARKVFEETRNPREALDLMPVNMHYERAILHHLIEKPKDYKGALLTIPPKLLSMFVSAFQSYMFNRTLSMRIETGNGNIFEPETGDRLLFSDGREDVVTERTLKTAKIHTRRGKCSVAIYMPGSEDFSETGAMDRYALSIMDELRISKEGYENISSFVGARFTGASRAIDLKTDLNSSVCGDTINLKFTLPPGHYATTVCREIMKADPKDMA